MRRKSTPSRNNPNTRRALRIEPLEDRRMLAVGGVETPGQALELFSVSPALFVENQGQWADESVRYAFFGDGANVLHTDTGPVFQLFDRDDSEVGVSVGDVGGVSDGDQDPFEFEPPSAVDTSDIQMAEFSVRFDGAAAIAPVGLDPAQTVYNYYVGDQSTWRSGVPTFETVAYPGLYEGIDLLTWGRRTSLKYEFHVAPGADYQQIQVHYDGIDDLWLDEAGVLHVVTPLGELVDEAPYIYQVIGGEQVEVPGEFELVDEDTYTFTLTGDYDPTIELVIDPVLDWGTYLGSHAWDGAYAVDIDSVGNVLLTGVGRPGTVSGGFDTSFNGANDAFAVKLSPTGAHLWSTYLGGSEHDIGYGIAVDSADNVLVTGLTKSPGWVSGGFDTTYNGGEDGFAAMLSPLGAHVWSTYLGGNADDSGKSIAVDSDGNARVTGYTESSGWVSGGFDTTLGGVRDGFVVKLSATGDHLWSTYIGGTTLDGSESVTVDQNGNTIVTGYTTSARWISGGFDTTYNNGDDAFIVKLSPAGEHLWSTYVGGRGGERGYGVAVDFAGNVLMTGSTTSSDWVSGGFDTTHGGLRDIFVIKLSPAGKRRWSTYLGGSGHDEGLGIAADAVGNVLLTGRTVSFGWVSGGFDTTHGDDVYADAFVAMLDPAGKHLWSTYLGGDRDDIGRGIAVDPAGNILVVGSTRSTFGWLWDGIDITYNGGWWDGFVAKIADVDDRGPRVFESSMREGSVRPVTRLVSYTANFSEPLDPASVVADNVVLVADTLGPVAPTSVTYDARTSRLTAWFPSLPGDQYTLTLRSGVDGLRDLAGNHLDGERDPMTTVPSGDGTAGGDFEFRFTVDDTPPRVIDSSILQGDILSSGTFSYTARFDEPLRTSWLNSYVVTLVGQTRGTREPASFQYDPDAWTITVEFRDLPDDAWTLTLISDGESGIEDAVRNALDGERNAVTTVPSGDGEAGGDFAIEFLVDTSQPRVTESSIYEDGAREPGPLTYTARFSEPLDGDRISVDSVVLVGSTVGPLAAASVVYNAATNWLSATFDNLPEDDYTLTLVSGQNALADLAGNALDGERHETTTVPSGDGAAGGDFEVHFTVAARPPVIDPGPDWGTYIGGDDRDGATAMAVDAEGNILVTGTTKSAGWVSGGFDTTYNGRDDAFVIKLSPTGEHLWSTYLGGSGNDRARDIAVDSAGNVLVTGNTDSRDWVSGGYDTSFNDGFANSRDAFAVKLSPAGDHLWSTYLTERNFPDDFGLPDNFGGGYAYGIAVDSADNVLITGSVNPACICGNDAFVTQLSPTGDLLWNTYLTYTFYGNVGNDIAVDADDNVFVTGETTTEFENSNGFVTKISPSGDPVWNTFFGDVEEDVGQGIAVDTAGNVLVTGFTESPGWVSGGFDTTFDRSDCPELGEDDWGEPIHVDCGDAFVVKISPNGEHLWSTLVGGTDNDYGRNITVDAEGYALLTGTTRSPGWVTGGLNTTLDGFAAAFVTKISPFGSHVWSTYFSDGGIGDLAVDSQRRILLAGTTVSSGWLSGGFDTTFNGGRNDAFVTTMVDVSGPTRVVDSSIREGDARAVGELVYTAQFSEPLELDRVVADNVVLVGDTTGLVVPTSVNYTSGTATLTASFPVLAEDQYTLTLPGGEGGLIDWKGRRLDGEPHATTTVPSGDGTEGGDFEVHFSVDDTPPRVIASSILQGDVVSAHTFLYTVQFDEPLLASVLDNADVRLTSDQGHVRPTIFSTTQFSYDQETFTLTLGFLALPDGVFTLTLLSGPDQFSDRAGNRLDGERHPQDTVPSGDGTDGGNFEIQFTVDGPPPVIEAVLDWSTYLGGDQEDRGNGIAVDPAGNVLVTGSTENPGWVSGGFDTSFAGTQDAFVAKLSPAGEHLWSTYLGGDQYERGIAIAVDSDANVFVTGTTRSPGWVSGGFNTTYVGGVWGDIFVVKLSPNGEHLWSTYWSTPFLDDNDREQVFDITVDSVGNVLLTGRTNDGELDEDSYALVIKIGPSGEHLWTRYLGSGGSSFGFGIAVDSDDNILVTGETTSSRWGSGGFDTTLDGSTDGFLTKLSPDGDRLWSTYLGGNGADGGRGVTVDSASNVLVTGITRSSGWVSGGYDTTFDGTHWTAFAVKVSPTGDHLWSTYFGGAGLDFGSQITVDSVDNVLVTGHTESGRWVAGGFSTSHNGGFSDGFVVKLNPSGEHLWSTFLGGSERDSGLGIALDAADNIFVTGFTHSSGWISDGFDTTFGGVRDAFVVKISPRESPPADLTGNGFVDFEDLTLLLSNWNEDVSAAEGNLVNPGGTPVNFEDLTVLLAAWTGPAAAGAPVGRRLAAAREAVGGDSVGDVVGDGPLVAVGDASYRRRDETPRRAAGDGSATGVASYRGRRDAARSRPAGGIYGGRLQAAAVDRVLEVEEGIVRSRAFARRR
ncbi:MAG: SBBP repeat-containing protein [Planctomycetes bacterium]|nr:SBBP repeat-containing protein [Planctomycetota bacterium]